MSFLEGNPLFFVVFFSFFPFFWGGLILKTHIQNMKISIRDPFGGQNSVGPDSCPPDGACVPSQ